MPKIASATDTRKPNAAQKPREDFPLFPHARGYWAKKVKGKMHYFGRIDDDPKGVKALKEWMGDNDSLLADARFAEPGQPPDRGRFVRPLPDRQANDRCQRRTSPTARIWNTTLQASG